MTPAGRSALRMTLYKRPDLLSADLERPRAIARRLPFRRVYAGTAHPSDADGKRPIVNIHRDLAALRPDTPSAFLPNYRLEDAALLVAGTGLWLNTPLPRLEASTRDVMDAALFLTEGAMATKRKGVDPLEPERHQRARVEM